MIYGGTGAPAVSPAMMPRGGVGMGQVGDLSQIPLPQLSRLASQDSNPALKAAATAEIGKRGSSEMMTPQLAMPEPPQSPLAAVATGAVTAPGQLPTVPVEQTNPAMDAIATGSVAADATAAGVPSALDQGVPPSPTAGTGPQSNPALTAVAVAPADTSALMTNAATIGGMTPSGVPLHSPQDTWLALAKGFGQMAASRQPGLLGAIGEGAGSAADAMMANRSRDIASDQNQQVIDLNKGTQADKIAQRQQQMQFLLQAVAQLPPELRTQAMANPDAFFGAQFKSMFDQQQVPAAIQEYNAAVQGGFKGSFADYQLMLKQAGRSTTNINMPKSINAGDSKMLELGAQDYLQSQQVLPMFDIAADAAKRAPNTGMGGQLALWYQRGKAALGLPNNAQDYEVLQGMQTKLGALARLPGSGSTSDMEMSLYMQAAPGLFNSQSGNLALASIGKKLTQRRISNYQKLQSYISTNGSSVGYQPDDSPVLNDDELSALRGAASGASTDTSGASGSTPPAGAPEGTKRAADGKWYAPDPARPGKFLLVQ